MHSCQRLLKKAEDHYNTVADKIPDSAAVREKIAGSVPFIPAPNAVNAVKEHTESWFKLLKRHSIRLFCYGCVFLYLRQNKCELQSASSWIAGPVRWMFGECLAAADETE